MWMWAAGAGGVAGCWLSDGQEIACAGCGGINRAMVDAESEPYFAACEDEGCVACEGEKGATRG